MAALSTSASGPFLWPRGRRLEHPLEEQPALGEHQVDVDTGRDLQPRGVLPGADRVGPRLHLEGPQPGLVGRDPGGVPVGDVRVLDHRDRRVLLALGIGEDDLGAEPVVSLAEHAGGDGEGLADGALRGQRRGVGGGIDDGRDVHDGDASDHALHTFGPVPATQPRLPRGGAGCGCCLDDRPCRDGAAPRDDGRSAGRGWRSASRWWPRSSSPAVVARRPAVGRRAVRRRPPAVIAAARRSATSPSTGRTRPGSSPATSRRELSVAVRRARR